LPDFRGLRKETLGEYLSRGGIITRVNPGASGISFTLYVKPLHPPEDALMLKAVCVNCVFYKGNQDAGRCSYFPPVSSFGFAKVTADSSCSRFRREAPELPDIVSDPPIQPAD